MNLFILATPLITRTDIIKYLVQWDTVSTYVQSTHVMTSKLLQNYVNMLRGSSCDIVLMHSTLTYLGSPKAVWYLEVTSTGSQSPLQYIFRISDSFPVAEQMNIDIICKMKR